MAFSSLADMSRRIPHGGRQSSRNSKITGVGIHHNAGVNAYVEASNPRREVSANYWITNEGVIIPNIDENFRAWTSGAPGYPAGAQADHRNVTVEVSNSPEGVRTKSWAISAAAQKALEKLIADVYKRHNLGTVKRGASKGVGIHRDWVPTECPGNFIVSKLSEIIKNAESYRKGGSGGSVKPPAPKPKVKTLSQLATEVLAGKHGNGDARKRSLGSQYAAVQAEVNRRLAGKSQPKPKVKTVSQLATEVLAGKHGNGDARKKSLGSQYSAVQAEVNRRLSGKSQTKTAAKTTSQLATEVLAGKHGNGDARKRSLGSQYSAVQAEVNRRLGI